MEHTLDRPVWAALAHMPHLAEGGPLARRYLPDVNLFAAACDDSPESLRALAALLPAEGRLYLAQAARVVVPPGLQAQVSQAVQMVAVRPIAAGPADAGDEAVVDLGDADAAEMLALARLTEPGPFLPRTHTMGRFAGIRIGGRLAAMAGTRMAFPGFVEVSGVCTHPDFRGRGLARRLSAIVAQRIQQAGDQAFLHAWAGNRAAIDLYASLGFELRTPMHVAVLERRA